ncbi:N-acetylmuramoyl-L-alanine amidase [Niabella insulamsoli]|uniref:N-acetylmuramoyl-L-alanine amidase n=1 Tax=Niabella insulamsoli TaxID=3144874 RepID=UPI0031FC7E48
MRKINYLIIHCTATPQSTTIDSIKNYWKNNLGWKNPGYHYIIEPNGNVVNLLPIDKVSNGVGGWNSQIINISYIGGIDTKGRAMDNRTPEQKAAILRLLKELKAKFPKASVAGHRDFPNVHKACPSFNAKAEYAGI